MKKILAISFVLLSVGFAVAQKPKSGYKNVGSELPPLRVVDSNLKAHSEVDIAKKKNFFLVMFNPTCHHCIDMAKMFGAHEADFKNNTVMFVSASDMLPYLGHFYKESGIGESKFITVGVDSSNIINNLYKYGNLPQINIYDKHKKLVRVYSGETAVDSLLQYAN